jgi:hypothetical protein
MKKGFLYLGIVAALLSCNKALSPDENIPEEPQLVEGSILELDFSINDSTEPDTRGIQKDWSHGDEVYIFFDKAITSTPQYMIAKYDKSGSVTGKAKSWYAKSWTSGLEAKISKRSSGVLSALYPHVSSVYGNLSVSYEDASTYTLKATQNKGDDFYSYWLEATNVSYQVVSGKLKASFSLARPEGLYFSQFSMPNKDRQGKTISNADASSSTVYQYSLLCQSVNTINGYNNDFYYGLGKCTPNAFKSDGTFGYYRQEKKGGWLSAYIYGGLCFSGMPTFWEGQELGNDYEFRLRVYNGSGYKYYKFTPSRRVAVFSGAAYTLPALNAKDSNGNYYWVEQ